MKTLEEETHSHIKQYDPSLVLKHSDTPTHEGLECVRAVGMHIAARGIEAMLISEEQMHRQNT